MTVQKLLVIGYVWPEPNSSAAGSRMLQLIDIFLKNKWQVVFASAAALSEHRFDLSTIGVEEKTILLNDSSFDEWINQLQPQAVLFDRFFTEEQFGWRVERTCPKALRLLDTEDLHSLRHARHQLLKLAQKNTANEVERQSVDPILANPDELYSLMSNDDMAVREIAAIYRCDLSIMISEFEIEFLQHYFNVPSAQLCYCPLLLPKSSNELLSPDFSDRQHFISIGNFRHEPNWDAVLYLKHAIWPRIRKQLPQAELHIYGAYPPPKATQLHQPLSGFYVKGWADDAMRVMRSARVCLAPLRFGAGIKGKLIDTMRSGTPSVTTAIGAEAMNGGLPWGGVIENSAQEFAEAAVELYKDKTRWEKCQKQGFSILENYFARHDYADLFSARIISLQKNIGVERQSNFVGAMLRHHSLKSTQYMSQWIEEKNRVK